MCLCVCVCVNVRVLGRAHAPSPVGAATEKGFGLGRVFGELDAHDTADKVNNLQKSSWICV